MILYDLKGKSNSKRTQILRKLYGYKDKSNYDYTYERDGLLDNLNLKRYKKTVLYVKNKKNASKIAAMLKELKVEFELVRF